MLDVRSPTFNEAFDWSVYNKEDYQENVKKKKAEHVLGGACGWWWGYK